jgi:hypothetical protein
VAESAERGDGLPLSTGRVTGASISGTYVTMNKSIFLTQFQLDLMKMRIFDWSILILMQAGWVYDGSSVDIYVLQ